MTTDSAPQSPLGPDPQATLLLGNVQLIHGRDTCDEAGRPLAVYICDYHQGFEHGLDEVEDIVESREFWRTARSEEISIQLGHMKTENDALREALRGLVKCHGMPPAADCGYLRAAKETLDEY